MKTIVTMTMDPVVRKQSVSVQRSACLCSKPVLQAILLGAVYSLLIWTVMAQEPLSKAGEPQKVAAPAKEELTSALLSLPFIVFGLLILALSMGAGMLTAGGARAFLRRRCPAAGIKDR